MQEQIDNLSRQYAEAGREAVGRVRQTLDSGAEWVATRKQPLRVLTDKTLKLNRITHNSAARLVRVQAGFIEGTLDGAAQRLHAAASASDVRTLVDRQVGLIPATRERLVTDARNTLEVLGDTRDEIVALVRETLDDLRIPGKVASAVDDAADAVEDTVEKVRREVRPTVRRTSKTPRNSAVRKTAARKTAPRKTATRKAAARTTTARRGAATRKTRKA